MSGKTKAAAPAAGTGVTEGDALEDFCDAMFDRDIRVNPAEIIADGKLHRIHADGDSKNVKDGWYVLHADDKPAGKFGHNGKYGYDVSFPWSMKVERAPLSAEEKRAYREKMAADRARREAEEAARHAAAADLANRIWDAATPVEGDAHPYLARKGIQSYGLRVGTWEKVDHETGEVSVISKNALLIPIWSRKVIHSLQAILPDAKKLGRDKDYLSGANKHGHYYSFGRPCNAKGHPVESTSADAVILICEGYATGASLHQATGHAVIVAFDAPNLLPVAEEMRRSFPDATIVVCADNDQWTLKPIENPGLTRASEVRDAIGALVAIPEFDNALGVEYAPGKRKGPSDFNDLAQRDGAEAVRRVIANTLNPPVVDALAGPLGDDVDHGYDERAPTGRVPGSDGEEHALLAPALQPLTVEDMKGMFAKCQTVQHLDVAAVKIREQNISDADLAIVVPQYQNTFKLLSDGRSVSAADARLALRLLQNDAERAVVAELNAQHAVVLAGDKAVVLRESPRETGELGFEVRLLSESAFRMFYRNRTVDITIERDGETRKKTVPIADWWLKSADRRTYEGITFAPGISAHPDYYNLWHGYAVEPRAGSLLSNALKCRRLLSHIKMNVCRGNRDHFRYLLAWAADMLQDPGKKKGVALVLRGNKGSGKSKVAEALASLLGQHSIKIAQMKHLVGNFNRHLSNKLLVVAEESFWAGDKADDGPLKDMITSSTLTLEAKGIDAIEMKSFARIMMITNNSWAVPATSDERRYFVLDVGNDRREDYAYFAAIDKQLDDNDQEGRRALLAFLLAFDLSTVNLRKVPETAALREQRGLSLEPHDQFIYDALIDRQIAGVSWEWATELTKEEVYNAYIDAGKKRSKSHLLAKNRLTSHLEKFGIKARKGTTGNRAPVYWLPDWSVAAEKFQAVMGVDIVALSEPVEEGVMF